MPPAPVGAASADPRRRHWRARAVALSSPEHANVWNNLGWAHGRPAEEADVLRAHCDQVKRDFDTIEVSRGQRGAIAETEAEAQRATDAICAEPALSSPAAATSTSPARPSSASSAFKSVAMGATSFVISFGRNPRHRDARAVRRARDARLR